MKIIATLQKPFTEEERMDFIVKKNHEKGLLIEETDDELQALDYTDEEKNAMERERINTLSLTAADVERAIYKAKGMDFEDVMELVEKLTLTPTLSPGEGESAEIDIKALKIELKANHFYRGNQYIDIVGSILGFTSEMLDEFFETGDWSKLVSDSVIN